MSENNSGSERLKEQVGNALKFCREANGLTQTDLAEMTGMTQSSVSKIERNQNQELDLSLLCKIFDAMNIDIELSFEER